MMKKRPLLEVCVDSPLGLAIAVKAGAERIELCAGLSVSGLTPSLGLMKMARRLGRPARAMIRPRPGDFCYEAAEIDVMRQDIDAAREAGLEGVVFGASHACGALDDKRLRILMDHAEGLSVTLHRAFDLTPDFKDALETAIALGFMDVLTSGGAKSALAGADQITELVVQARGRIGVMAGAGVIDTNVVELIQRTRVEAVHASCSAPLSEPVVHELYQRALTLDLASSNLRHTSGERIRTLIAALDAFDLGS